MTKLMLSERHVTPDSPIRNNSESRPPSGTSSDSQIVKERSLLTKAPSGAAPESERRG
jgi:hypothetical protein